ncbi:repressor LexA [Anaerobranca californiensis DSM 14826]|jgi:repressor LexA|uniref:LexA repressor n=1 Tax=Anaerobranca californiensis DSM 14826 TaxID=1120989 RepID=A0A1M6K926_9FIRM|nr:transcriptional repressor LexA [Anaerobranca californiensis]SHJ55414.1 repressor LexA [Anaerobranca californiensis DSM 14826]
MELFELTDRQKEILEFIQSQVKLKGYPPSVREIGLAVGLKSSSTVHAHLAKLEELGYIRRDPTKPRAIELLYGQNETIISNPGVIQVPVVGKVTAGLPILAQENIEEYFPVPENFIKGSYNTFMLSVIGDSMVNAGIFDGDLVLVQQTNHANNGDIVVALIEDEATVKKFYKEKDYIRLQPENELYKPIYVKNPLILGKVIGLFRSL